MAEHPEDEPSGRGNEDANDRSGGGSGNDGIADGDEAGAGAQTEMRPLRLRRFISLILALLVLYLAATLADVWWATQRTTEIDAQAALVLGAAQYNGTPSPVLVRRLDRAAELYADGQVELVVVTGGQQEGDITTEGKAGYDYLRQAGLPDSALRVENQGDSTYTSMAAAARFLRSEDIDSVILVTDAYHARRVQLIADEVGLNAKVAAVGSARWGPMARETAAVALGRIVGFRRLDNVRDLFP